jgi:predicted enzyme related to lactoylglutathione lyase
MDKQSRFVWHDLNVEDPADARRFYGELFGWKFTGKTPGDDYLHIEAGGQMIGGLRKKQPHEPAHWVGYVDVADVAATVKKVEQAGGKVYMPATTMANVGTFAVIADPTGGVVCPWRSARPGEDVEKGGLPAPFTFCWDELLSTDVGEAERFYTAVFGWGVDKVPMGPDAVYTLFKRPGVSDGMGGTENAGGLWPSPAPASFWMAYVAVPDCDATFAKAKQLGAKVQMEPTDIPNVGRFASLADPQGAGIAILQPESA